MTDLADRKAHSLIRDTALFGFDAAGALGGVTVNADGSLKATPPVHPLVSTNLATTTATAPVDVSDCAGLVIHCKGVFSTMTAVFEASLDSTNGTDGTWFGVMAARSNGNTIEVGPAAISAAPAYAWEVSINGYRWFRIRHTALTSGTVTWLVSPTMYGTEVAPAIQTHPVTGSGTFTVSPATQIGIPITVTSAASTNAASHKVTAGNIWEVTCSNPTATPAYVKLYDKASAPTVGTDIPKVTIPVPAGACVSLSFGAAGKRFSAGIASAITAAAAATDVANAVAGVQVHGTYI